MAQNLPPELAAKLRGFLREVDGSYQITDMAGLIGFILEHADEYPGLLDIVDVNTDAVVEHFERTGEVPPGIKLIRKTNREGSNITDLEVLHGPIPPRNNVDES